MSGRLDECGKPTFSRLLDSKQIMMVSNKNCVNAQKMSMSPGPKVGETFSSQHVCHDTA